MVESINGSVMARIKVPNELAHGAAPLTSKKSDATIAAARHTGIEKTKPPATDEVRRVQTQFSFPLMSGLPLTGSEPLPTRFEAGQNI